ncbi:MAG: DUF3047 domain-containing protein [Granulosicoccus sp.]
MNRLPLLISTPVTVTLAASILLASSTGWGESANNPDPLQANAFGTVEGWKERSFAGNTEYQLVELDGVDVLQGHTQGQASIFYKEQDINLEDTPVVNWSWKIERAFENIDERTREGDDFPARLYVVARVGLLPWNTLAINYLWASQNATGTQWASPYTEKAMMVAVQSGNDDAGEWTTHSRNVADDFQTLFGRKVEKIQGYAVMVDGDNTGNEATAWFGNIRFSE